MYVFGELKHEKWVVGQLHNKRLLYAKEVYSPIMQNNRHIEDLQALYFLIISDMSFSQIRRKLVRVQTALARLKVF